MRTCIACGMPMKKKDDYAMGDKSKDYCKYCMKPDGSMQSYDEKLKSMTAFIIKTQGLDENASKICAASMLSKLPAWKNLSRP